MIASGIENLGEIIIAFFALMGVVATAMFNYLGKKKADIKMEAVEEEVELHKYALSFDDFFTEWQAIEGKLQTLFEETNIERFLLLRAFNGVHEPKWTNAIFQLRSGKAANLIDYKFVELDRDYINRLSEITDKNKITFKVENLSDSLIKKIYVAEEVKHASWFHISSYLTDSGCKMITYCSFATTKDEPIDKNTEIKCQLIANRFKIIADSLIPHKGANS